jgi:hypothetical protein
MSRVVSLVWSTNAIVVLDAFPRRRSQLMKTFCSEPSRVLRGYVVLCGVYENLTLGLTLVNVHMQDSGAHLRGAEPSQGQPCCRGPW